MYNYLQQEMGLSYHKCHKCVRYIIFFLFILGVTFRRSDNVDLMKWISGGGDKAKGGRGGERGAYIMKDRGRQSEGVIMYNLSASPLRHLCQLIGHSY